MYPNATNKKARLKFSAILGAIFFVGLAAIVIASSIPPSDFPSGTIITIQKSSGLSGIADDLAAQGVIKSAFLYKVYVVLLHDGHGVQAGDYFFDSPQSALRVAYRTAYGIEGLPRIKVTIPEGSDSAGMTAILDKDISGFASTTFFSLVKSQEGYLFPDTYFFYENTTPQEVVDAMRNNFDTRIVTASSSISAFIASTKTSSGDRYSLNDIIKMASIVEKEAISSADRRIIAGILWKRLAAGMALQVDPPFYYFLGKTSAELTLDDLKISSPYNLYLNKGLPPTPIDSPGLGAILDTVMPTTTPYWFYISDKDGTMHYAATLDVHNENIAKFLN